MAIPNLFQKADTTLVEMAYKAADAQTPADMSVVFQHMAAGYDRTMRLTAQAWKNVVTATTPLIKEAVSNFAESAKYNATADQDMYRNKDKINMFMDGYKIKYLDPKGEAEEEFPSFEDWMEKEYGVGTLYNNTDISSSDMTIQTAEEWWEKNETMRDFYEKEYKKEKDKRPKYKEEHIMGLNQISEELKKTWFNGKSRQENQTRRIELNRQKQAIWAEIDLIEGGMNNITKLMASGNFHEKALNGDPGNLRLLTAVSAMYTPFGKTAKGDFAGDYVDFSRDEEGRMTLNLFNKKDEKILRDSKDKNSPQVSIAISNLQSLVTPKFTKDQREPYERVNEMYFGMLSDPSVNFASAKAAYVSSLTEIMPKGTALVSFMHEKHLFDGQTLSFHEEVLGNNGNGSEISGAIFSVVNDFWGKDAENNKQKLPMNADETKPMPLDISAGDPDEFDLEDLMDKTIGTKNFTLLVSNLTNPSKTFYNEEVLQQAIIEFYAGKQEQKAKLIRGEKLAANSWWGEMGTITEQNSQAAGINILDAIISGNVDSLVFPKRGDGGPGKLKLVTSPPYDQDNPARMEFIRDGVTEYTFDPTNNENIIALMMNEGVLQSHINSMITMTNPSDGSPVMDWKNPLWNSRGDRKVSPNDVINSIYDQATGAYPYY